MNEFKSIIKKICLEKDIKYTELSKGWIIVLEKDDKIRYICGYKFDLNNYGIGSIMDDKYALFELLKYKNIPVIDHKILFENYDEQEIKEYFYANDNQVIVKSNSGTCGNEVFRITDLKELFVNINKLLISNYSISICPFYKIKTEYRVIVYKNKAILCYGKRRPIVVGNGKSTIKELLIVFNPNYFINKDNLQNIDLKYVPAKDEICEIGWKFNLSKGSVPFEIMDQELKNKLEKMAEEIASTINIKFGSIDIILTIDNKLLVLETNSGIMMDNYIKETVNGYEIAKEIYTNAINEMFNN